MLGTARSVAAGVRKSVGSGPRLQRDGGGRGDGIVTSPSLRDYQLEAVEACELAAAAGQSRALVTLPTGTGKTVVFCELIRRRARTCPRHRAQGRVARPGRVQKLIDAGIPAQVHRTGAGRP